MNVRDRLRNAMKRHDRQMLSALEAGHFHRELGAAFPAQSSFGCGAPTSWRPLRSGLNPWVGCLGSDAAVFFVG
ncbi:MAG: hypothetical protein ACREBW_02550, partial [Candidatus Micrarchaeaceae archaeon]